MAVPHASNPSYGNLSQITENVGKAMSIKTFAEILFKRERNFGWIQWMITECLPRAVYDKAESHLSIAHCHKLMSVLFAILWNHGLRGFGDTKRVKCVSYSKLKKLNTQEWVLSQAGITTVSYMRVNRLILHSVPRLPVNVDTGRHGDVSNTWVPATWEIWIEYSTRFFGSGPATAIEHIWGVKQNGKSLYLLFSLLLE